MEKVIDPSMTFSIFLLHQKYSDYLEWYNPDVFEIFPREKA